MKYTQFTHNSTLIPLIFCALKGWQHPPIQAAFVEGESRGSGATGGSTEAERADQMQAAAAQRGAEVCWKELQKPIYTEERRLVLE